MKKKAALLLFLLACGTAPSDPGAITYSVQIDLDHASPNGLTLVAYARDDHQRSVAGAFVTWRVDQGGLGGTGRDSLVTMTFGDSGRSELKWDIVFPVASDAHLSACAASLANGCVPTQRYLVSP